MKKIFVLIAAISFNALATVPTNDIRLSFTKHRLINWTQTQLELNVKLDSKGLVFADKEDGSEVFVGFLTDVQMAEVEDLIDVAARTDLEMGPPEFCLAIPTQSVVYAADNGEIVLLSDTSPCGGSSLRKGAAVEKLIEMLDVMVKEVPETNILIAELNG